MASAQLSGSKIRGVSPIAEMKWCKVMSSPLEQGLSIRLDNIMHHCFNKY